MWANAKYIVNLMKEEGFFFLILFSSKCVFTPKTLAFPCKKLQHNLIQKQVKFPKNQNSNLTLMGLDFDYLSRKMQIFSDFLSSHKA
jgi:hypothetical protein